jgi:hypothetical protein
LIKQFKKLKEILREKKEKSRIFEYIKPELKRFLDRFQDKKKDSEFQYEFARWFFENKRYANSLISLNESILTKLCEIYGKETRDRKSRGIFKSFLKEKNYYSQHPEIKKLHDIYIKLNKKRVKVAHASLNEDHMIESENNYNDKFKKLGDFVDEDVYFLNDIDDLESYIKDFDPYINSNKLDKFKDRVSYKKLEKKFNNRK